jgi:hypothetical protein
MVTFLSTYPDFRYSALALWLCPNTCKIIPAIPCSRAQSSNTDSASLAYPRRRYSSKIVKLYSTPDRLSPPSLYCLFRPPGTRLDLFLCIIWNSPGDKLPIVLLRHRDQSHHSHSPCLWTLFAFFPPGPSIPHKTGNVQAKHHADDFAPPFALNISRVCITFLQDREQ